MRTSSRVSCALLIVALVLPSEAGASRKDVAAQAAAALGAVAKAVAEANEKPKPKRKRKKKGAAAAKPGARKGADADADAPSATGKATMPVPKDPHDFGSFWASFQTVIAAEDEDALVGLTKFPFETTGPVEGARISRRDAGWVKAHLDDLLDGISSDEGMDEVVASTTPAAAAKEVHGNGASIGSFTFAKTAKGWRFVSAFTLSEDGPDARPAPHSDTDVANFRGEDAADPATEQLAAGKSPECAKAPAKGAGACKRIAQGKLSSAVTVAVDRVQLDDEASSMPAHHATIVIEDGKDAFHAQPIAFVEDGCAGAQGCDEIITTSAVVRSTTINGAPAAIVDVVAKMRHNNGQYPEDRYAFEKHVFALVAQRGGHWRMRTVRTPENAGTGFGRPCTVSVDAKGVISAKPATRGQACEPTGRLTLDGR